MYASIDRSIDIDKEIYFAFADTEKFQDLKLTSWGPGRGNGTRSSPKAEKDQGPSKKAVRE